MDEEERLRSFIEAVPGFSETAASLAAKLGVSPRTARQVLDRYVELQLVQRRSFERRIEPVYFRFPAMGSPAGKQAG
jgi:predicted ArsR family transcriptional regulator